MTYWRLNGNKQPKIFGFLNGYLRKIGFQAIFLIARLLYKTRVRTSARSSVIGPSLLSWHSFKRVLCSFIQCELNLKITCSQDSLTYKILRHTQPRESPVVLMKLAPSTWERVSLAHHSSNIFIDDNIVGLKCMRHCMCLYTMALKNKLSIVRGKYTCLYALQSYIYINVLMGV